MGQYIDIMFDAPPGPEPGRFIEVEDAKGNGVRVGDWIERDDGTWALRITCEEYARVLPSPG